ncbi:MAG: membrane protein insertion efficiency factor YidD [Candidatus Margulisbacteria bacterium]|nr:membrane protein insertion efficiency factor YidD [Candidatus Margulisiibacteriota bacterium]
MSKQLILYTIRLYQKVMGYIKGPTCRFYPTCSQYAYLAIQTKGVFRGLGLGMIRISKCHPFHPGGIDEIGVKHGSH